MKFTMSFLILFLCSILLSASTPEAVKKDFASRFPKAGQVKWFEPSTGVHLAKFNSGGKDHVVSYKATGQWIETRTAMPLNEAPKGAAGSAYKYNEGFVTESAEKVEHISKGVYYVFRMKSDKGVITPGYRANGEPVK